MQLQTMIGRLMPERRHLESHREKLVRQARTEVISLTDTSLLRHDPDDVSEIIGNKALNLIRLNSLGLPVPSGVVVSARFGTSLTYFLLHRENISSETHSETHDEAHQTTLIHVHEKRQHFRTQRHHASSLYLAKQLDKKKDSERKLEEMAIRNMTVLARTVGELESQTGKKFDDTQNPLFVSARSGAKESMPGAMDTVLNIGLTDITFSYYAKKTGFRNATRAYIELIEDLATYPGDESGIPEIQESLKTLRERDNLTEDEAREYIEKAKAVYREIRGTDFPQNGEEQLLEGMDKVYMSWHGDRARYERKKRLIPDKAGTACIVQEMILGNVEGSETAGSGVLLTRDPNTYGGPVIDFKQSAQGKDVVGDAQREHTSWDELVSTTRGQLSHIIQALEQYTAIPQDVEFTVDGESKVWALQTRDAKMAPLAKLRMLLQHVDAANIKREQAVRGMKGSDARVLLLPTFRPDDVQNAREHDKVLTSGFAPVQGSFSGRTVYSLEEAKLATEPVVLVARLTLDDCMQLPLMVQAVVTEALGNGSHAVRHLEAIAFARGNMPILLGANLEKLNTSRPQYLSVFTEGSSGGVIEGLLPIDHPPNLTSVERAFVEEVIVEKTKHPWAYVTRPLEAAHLLEVARAKTTRSLWRSVKATENAVFSQVIPESMRDGCSLFKPDDIDAIKRELHRGIKMGLEVSIRTCHLPQEPAKGPWQGFTTHDEIETYFKKGGGYNLLRENHRQGIELETIIVNAYHRGKLDSLKRDQHFCATVKPTADNTLILQILPRAIHLRDMNDTEKARGIVTVELTGLGMGRTVSSLVRPSYNVVIDGLSSLMNDLPAMEMVFYAIEELQHWMEKHDLLRRMEIIAQALPEGFSTPVFEMQGHVNRGRWAAAYGINADMATN